MFTDIDHTLTADGAITPDAQQALHNLKAAGLHVIAITGRSVGWSAQFAWIGTVDTAVAGNGAVALQNISKIGLRPKQNLLKQLLNL